MRISLLPTALTALLAGCGPGSPSSTSPGPTAMYRGDPTHSGVYEATPGAELIGLQWRFETGGGVVSSPAVLGDTVWIGSGSGWLYALDRRTGRPRWKVDLGSPVASSPAVGGGRVIVGTRDGRFFAVRSGDGSRIWSFDTGPDRPFPWGRESGDQWIASAVLSGDLAVMGAGDGKVYGVDAATGSRRWSAETEGRIRSTPAIAGGRVFVGSADGWLYAFDLATGRRLWRFETLGASLESGNFGFDRRTIQSSPAVAGGTVYFGARDGLVYAVAADSGGLRWKYDQKVSWINTSPAVDGGVLYDGSSDAQFVQALDTETGRELWRTPAGVTWSSPALARGLLFIGDGEGRLRALDRTTGAIRWTFQTEGGIFGAPVPTGDLVIVGSLDGGVYALRTGATPVDRVVFADTSGWRKPAPGTRALIVSLVARGYRPVGGDSLAAFLEARVADRAPSVVVVATYDLPANVVTEPLAESVLRRYLDAGGKVVWPNRYPPLLIPRDLATGKLAGGLEAFHWDRPGRLLGMDMAGGIFDRRMVAATAEGERWGVSGHWLDTWGIAPAEVTEVLGRDDWGLAATWVKSFGGAPGTGWVRSPLDDPATAYRMAEYRPEGER